jgi:Tfp pilus assembly protein PilF
MATEPHVRRSNGRDPGPPVADGTDARIEEITRIVLGVLHEHDPRARRSRDARLWAWATANVLVVVTLVSVAGLVGALAINRVGFWAIATELASDYRAAEQRNELIDQHLELGDRLLGAEQLKASRVEFERVLAIEPTNVDAHRGVFKATIFQPIAEQQFDPSSAEVRLQSLIEIDPGDRDAHAFLGDLYRMQGDAHAYVADRGRGSQKEAARQNASRSYAAALAQYADGIDEARPLPHAYHGTGLVYLRQGQNDRAIEMFQLARDLAPGQQRYETDLAIVQYLVEDYTPARENFDQLLARDDRLLLPSYYLAAIWRLGDQLKRAREHDERLQRMLAQPAIQALERNSTPWVFPTRRGWVSISPLEQKRAITFFTSALTAHLLGDERTAAELRAKAATMRVTRKEAFEVRQVVLAMTARLQKQYPRDIERFRREGDRVEALRVERHLALTKSFEDEILATYGEGIPEA